MAEELKAAMPDYDMTKLFRVVVVGDGVCPDVRVIIPVRLAPRIEGVQLAAAVELMDDPSRPTRYFSTAMLSLTVHPQMPPQQIPVQFEIMAGSLGEALQKFPASAKEACEKRLAEMKDAAVRQQILAGTAAGKMN